ncbi:MAG: tetratricopeptide repeat protein [Chloroflexi bacterium]|nr:tetratricopeptide repeat protein [Chloroflexota bacterium]
MMLHISSRSWPLRFTGALFSACLLVASLASPAAAQSQPTVAPAPTPTDRIDLVGLVTQQPKPDSPPDQVQFQATVNYRLQTAQSGSVLLFLFENSASTSTQDTSNAIPIQQGNGQLVLNIDYTLSQDVKSLTLVAAVLKPGQKLAAWVSTNPIDMAPWPGRVYFEKAMTDRLANNFADAEQQLTQAIHESPDTGNYYYWRGDTRIRLQDYADALTDFNKSLDLMPRDRPSRVGRGIAELWLDNPQGAIDDLTSAIQAVTTPDHISAWAFRARGLAYANLGQSQSAVDDYNQYLTLTPDAPDRDQVTGWIADLSSS